MINFLGVIWGTPKNAWLFIFLIFSLVLLIYKFFKQKKIISFLVDQKHQKNFLLNYSTPKKIAKIILLLFSLFFLILAALSPRWNKKEQTVEQSGRDIFIALDISRSMLAQDLKPNRLEFAKQKVKKLLDLVKTDRVGLILFSGSAYIQCPLTRDFSAFYMYLDQVDTESISSGTTSMDKAIKLALATFKNISTNKKDKILIILTDGEDFSSDLQGLKKEISDENLHIFSIGIGTKEGAPIPLYDDELKQIGHQLDQHNNVVISKLNEGILSALSAQSNGYYVSSTNENDDLEKILTKIEFFEKQKFNDKKISNYEEQYPYFILMSFICLLLEWIL